MIRRIVLAIVFSLALGIPGAVSAHPHTLVTSGTTQVIANGQNHEPFVNGVDCGGDPAA